MSAISVRWLYVGWGAVTFETTYGLMQQSPLEIKEKLLKALDKEYNVVDMVAVLEIVSTLEKTSITKEALETTRLGKYINELRRKTRDDALAKRAKELVRRWRDMILTTPSPSPAPVPTPVPAPAPVVPSATTLNGSDPVPRTHASNKRLRKEGPDMSPSSAPPSKQPRLNGTVEPAPASAPAPSLTADDDRSMPPDSKRRGRKRGSKNRSTLKKEIGRAESGDDIVKEKIASIARTPRVKTTQELLADLKSKTDGTLPEPCPDDLTRSKSEHIEKFLRSQEEAEEDCESKSTQSTASSPNPTPTPTPVPPADAARAADTSVADILSRLPPLDPDAIDWGDGLGEGVGDGEGGETEEGVRPVRRLADHHWVGVNGCADHSGLTPDAFGEWHQTISRTTHGDQLLHILPYVVID